MKTKSYKNIFLYPGILAMQFLVCGSAYISQMYHLCNFFSSDMVTIITLRWNYFAQAFGIFCFIILFLKFPKLAGDRFMYIVSIVIATIIIAIILTSNNGMMVAALGFVFNIFIGWSSGFTLSMLTAHIPRRGLGLAFGIAYAFGSVGTYLISLMSKGNFLQSRQVIIAYVILNIISIMIIYASEGIPASEHTIEDTKFNKKHKNGSIQSYILVLIMLVLVNTISSLGNSFQFSVITEGNVNLPFSRAFYAISLISGGLISYRSRKYIALTTFAVLLYPVVAVIIAGDASMASALLTLSYLFLGFVSVYRSLMVMDIASRKSHLMAYASAGLMVSRLVEAASTWFGDITVTNKLLATIIFSVLFASLIFIFFMIMQKSYQTSPVEVSGEQKMLEFVQRYGFSPREKEIFQILIKGVSNREIAQIMYVTENTVKFHIKNILKKTDCTNRSDLINLYNTKPDYDVLV